MTSVASDGRPVKNVVRASRRRNSDRHERGQPHGKRALGTGAKRPTPACEAPFTHDRGTPEIVRPKSSEYRPAAHRTDALAFGMAFRYPAIVLAFALSTALGGCFGGAAFHLFGRSQPDARVHRDRVAAVPVDATTADVVHVSVFYDPLAPYGMWEEDPDLGWLWSPSDATYEPYRAGYWVDTDAGPTWMADEPFGWAVTHYGRWLWRDGRWLWRPGTAWAPAWVAWRVGEGAVGWAPLAPDGFEGAIPLAAWSFVAAPDFYTRGVAMRAYAPSYAGWFVYRTHPWSRWAVYDGRARYVMGPRVELGGRPLVERMPLAALPAERVRWIPRWSRPAAERPLIRSWASIRAARDGPDRSERLAPDLSPLRPVKNRKSPNAP